MDGFLKDATRDRATRFVRPDLSQKPELMGHFTGEISSGD
jgi:hypothetical protein